MNNDVKDESYSSGLHKPSLWLFLFVFFAVLPVLIYLSCYELFIENEFTSSRENLTQYYQRELTAFRNRATNRNIFLQLLQNYRDSCRKNIPDKLAENLVHLTELFDELPSNTSLISWNSNGEIVASFTRIHHSEKISEIQVRRFIDLLNESYSDFNSGIDLQTLQQTRDYELKNRPFFSSIKPLVGLNFPATRLFTQRNSLEQVADDRSEVFFFWDYSNAKDNSQGGFAAIIPRQNLPSTFALSRVLEKDPSANPEFTNGLFDSATGKTKLSFPQLQTVAEKMIAG
ncbi:MAG: hypothetical protein AB1403_26600, partial [Candidatus Riflebacteria bacterium]